MAPLEFVPIAAGSLIAAAWQGLVLAGVVAICLRMLPGITAAARSVVWTLVMLAVCVLPFIHLADASTDAANAPQVHLDEWVGLALVVVWALISLVRAGQLVRSALWLRGISRRAVAAADLVRSVDKDGVSDFAGMTSNMGSRRAELCVSDEVDRPCVVGFFRPRVLVPTGLFETLSAGEMRQIVMHEMEHLRRRDDWTNLLQKLSLVVFPLNPALMWIERQLCVERELACDDHVLKATGARKAYAACLANLAEHSLVRRGVSLALGAWERQSEVVRRVHRILAGSRNEMSPRRIAGVVAVLMVGVLAGADGLAHAPALVSFGPGTVNLAANSASPQLRPVAAGTAYGSAEPVVFSARQTSARATDVVFHPAAPMPAMKVRRPAVAVKAVKKVSTPALEAVNRAANVGHPTDEQSMVVMVTWQMASPVIVQDSQFTYAAVPTRNGWMFVQL